MKNYMGKYSDSELVKLKECLEAWIRAAERDDAGGSLLKNALCEIEEELLIRKKKRGGADEGI